MGNIKQIYIKNRRYYFFNDMISIKNFDSNLLKIDKKSLLSIILDTKLLKRLMSMKIFIA